MKKCPFCAEEIQDEAVKCMHCDSMLGGPPPQPSGPPAPRAKRFPVWAIVLITVGGVVALGVVLVAVETAIEYSRHSEQSKAETTKRRVRQVLDAALEYMTHPAIGHQGNCISDLKVLVPERVTRDTLKDAWNQPLRISCAGDRVCVYSVGRNKSDEAGGGDDIKACTETHGKE